MNLGYSRSLDPADFAFSEYTMESCDALRSQMDLGFDGGRYRPWTAKVTAIEPLASRWAGSGGGVVVDVPTAF